MGEEEEQEEIEMAYFFDSYAVIEIIKNNNNYLPYFDKDINLSIFNLAEIYYNILNNFNEEKANEIYELYKEGVVEITDEILKEAMKFRRENKKKGFSYADCIGYIYALENNMKFLTGDREFADMKNVEFVK